jgi:hypothetical protein
MKNWSPSDQTKCLGFRSLIACSGLLLCCGLTAILLLTVGYNNAMEWNNNSEEVICVVIERDVKDRQCSYLCNCHQVCTGTGSSRTCRNQCNTCYYTCYDGTVKYSYNDTQHNEHSFWNDVYNGRRSETDTKNDLDKHYPIGDKQTCYYNKNDFTDVKFKLSNPLDYYIASMIFFGLWVFFAFVYCISEIVFVIYNNKDKIELEW